MRDERKIVRDADGRFQWKRPGVPPFGPMRSSTLSTAEVRKAIRAVKAEREKQAESH
mgnify:CR=1 FL=1|jgi:hypothetical protein